MDYKLFTRATVCANAPSMFASNQRYERSQYSGSYFIVCSISEIATNLARLIQVALIQNDLARAFDKVLRDFLLESADIGDACTRLIADQGLDKTISLRSPIPQSCLLSPFNAYYISRYYILVPSEAQIIVAPH